MNQPPHECLLITTESGSTWILDTTHGLFKRSPSADANQWGYQDGLSQSFWKIVQLDLGLPLILWPFEPNFPGDAPAYSTSVKSIEPVDICLTMLKLTLRSGAVYLLDPMGKRGRWLSSRTSPEGGPWCDLTTFSDPQMGEPFTFHASHSGWAKATPSVTSPVISIEEVIDPLI